MPRPKANRRTKSGKARYTARRYVGNGRYEWVGTFDTPQARDQALLEAGERQAGMPTCDEWAERFLTRYARTHKASSHDTAKTRLKRFRKDFKDRALDSLKRVEMEDWVSGDGDWPERVPMSHVPMVVTLLNAAVDAELIDRNPARGLSERSRGRSDDAPPTEQELGKLIEACAVLDWYAPRMRALIRFAAYMGMRPGELFELKWEDIDFDAMRVDVTRRLYRGKVDVPKSGEKHIALTPPGLDAITSLPRGSAYVFTNKSGGRLAQETLGRYWRLVTARAGLDFDFYLATKHYCVHYLWVKLDLSERAIAEQMGWTTDEAGKAIKRLLGIYGHGNIGALEEIDAAFRRNVTPLRPVKDANEEH